jgi:hypothetical protein
MKLLRDLRNLLKRPRVRMAVLRKEPEVVGWKCTKGVWQHAGDEDTPLEYEKGWRAVAQHRCEDFPEGETSN